MEKPLLIYCYDAYCGWCFGFSGVMKAIHEQYHDRLQFEVLSGGMMTGEQAIPIEKIAPYIEGTYPQVEELTGVKFGEDFLWHIKNPQLSDWVMDSEKAAVALCIFKDYYPDKQVEFAAELQQALNVEGRDLADNEAYRHLLEKYSIQPEAFYAKLSSDEYIDQAHYEFSLCKQLQVNGFPSVLIQLSDTKFHLVARGYTDFNTLQERIEAVLQSVES